MAELLLTDGHRVLNNLFMDYAVFATAMKKDRRKKRVHKEKEARRERVRASMRPSEDGGETSATPASSGGNDTKL